MGGADFSVGVVNIIGQTHFPGYPPIKGATLLEKRRYVREHLDHLRRMLMREPRGHSDMYGVIVVEPDCPEADMAVLFMHNEGMCAPYTSCACNPVQYSPCCTRLLLPPLFPAGYSTMCGHAVIALGRYAIDYNLVKPVSPVTRVNIQCPCGLVAAYVQYEAGRSGDVHFESVPSFAFATDLTISLGGLGEVRYDIAYGGAFYVFVDIRQLSMDFQTTPTSRLAEVGFALKKAVMAAVTITHPVSEDLAFLYGTIITDDREGRGSREERGETQQLCVFANGQVHKRLVHVRTLPRITVPCTIGGSLSLWVWRECTGGPAAPQETNQTR